MLYLGVLAYLATIYIRPGEILASAFPFVFVMAVGVTAIAAVSLLMAPRNPVKTAGDKFFLAYAAAIVASQPAHGWFGGAFQALSAFGPTLFAYLTLRLAVTTERQLIGVIKAVTLFLLVQAISGIVQFHTGVGLGGVSTVENNRIQGTGIFNDPNDLGLSLVMVVPYLMSSVLQPRGGGMFRGLLSAPALAAVLLAIYYTNSRGAAFAVAVVFLMYSFLHIRRVMTSTALALVLLAGIVAVAPSRMSQLSAEEESTQGRVDAWYAGLSMFKAHPVVGVGFGEFTDQNALVAHNSFVHAFAELGFPGGFCLVGVFYWYFVSLKRPASPAVSPPAELSACSGAPEGSLPPPLVAPDWFGRTLVPDVVVSGIGVLVCIFFLSRQYDVVLGVVMAIGATAGTLYRQGQPGLAPRPITVTDLAAIAAFSVGVLASVSMLVRMLG